MGLIQDGRQDGRQKRTYMKILQLKYLIQQDSLRKIYIFDMAPNFFTNGEKRIGGKISDYIFANVSFWILHNNCIK